MKAIGCCPRQSIVNFACTSWHLSSNRHFATFSSQTRKESNEQLILLLVQQTSLLCDIVNISNRETLLCFYVWSFGINKNVRKFYMQNVFCGDLKEEKENLFDFPADSHHDLFPKSKTL
jgi:hypothetical protein